MYKQTITKLMLYKMYNAQTIVKQRMQKSQSLKPLQNQWLQPPLKWNATRVKGRSTRDKLNVTRVEG